MKTGMRGNPSTVADLGVVSVDAMGNDLKGLGLVSKGVNEKPVALCKKSIADKSRAGGGGSGAFKFK